MYFAPRKQRQGRLIGTMNGALHTELLASLVDQFGIVGMMYLIGGSGSGVENDRGPTLAQLRIGHQGGALGLLKGEDRTERKFVGMPQMATDQCPCGSAHDRNALLVDVVLFGILLQIPNGFCAMVHDLEVIPLGMDKERIIYAGEGHSLGMVLEELVFIKHGLVTVIEATPMKIDHQGHGLG